MPENNVSKSDSIKDVADGIIIKIKIIPNSPKNDIIIEDESIRVKVTAQPVENKANKALVDLLSKQLKVPKTDIEIVKGVTSKEKTVLLKVTDNGKKSNIFSKLSKQK